MNNNELKKGRDNKKNKISYKSIVLRIITIIITILLILVFYLIMPLISILLTIFLIIIEIKFNKIIEKIGYIKASIIFNIPLIIVVIFIIINNINSRIETIEEWNVIKDDYNLINEIVIKYYNENVEERGGPEKSIFLWISNDNTKLDDTGFYTDENGKFIYLDNKYINLTKEEQGAIKRIKEYYSCHDSIIIDEDIISYGNESGNFFIIYSQNSKKPNFYSEYSLIHLEDNWYKANLNWLF